MNQKFPKGEIKSIKGRSFTIKGDDIDTDRIIPARFLKCVSFSALGQQVFADDRKELKGDHPFDLVHNKGANILIVNDNFGCGSSREHAPQALMRWGIRLIIGESFAEIFFGNCLALGIPCLTASKEEIVKLQNLVEKNDKQIWDFNLKNLSISNQKETVKLILDEGPYDMLYSGKWDATYQLLNAEEKINKTFNNLPYLNNFKQEI
jgi:3-isopropylmalate/(R)-2-methylmalate dehydratase small subunit